MSSEHVHWLAALHASPVGTSTLLRLLAHYRQEPWWRWPAARWQAVGCPPAQVPAVIQAIAQVDPAWFQEQLASLQLTVVTVADPTYPRLLKEIPYPPPLLYVRGDVDVLQRPALAVVGTRRPTPYGLGAVPMLLTPVVRAGMTIVSGLALGIDGQAHRVAVEQRALTIAVLGSGLDIIYPPEHRQLAEDIVRCGGALISEFPLGARPERHHFPQRNRIISGLAKAVLLIEAGEKSGALITAKFAVDQNREVLVLPGPITSPQSVGPLNWLRLGATPVTSANDILQLFQLEPSVTIDWPIPRPSRPDEQERILTLIGTGFGQIDEIIEKSRLDSSVVATALSLLEVDGLVRHLGGQIYTLNT